MIKSIKLLIRADMSASNAKSKNLKSYPNGLEDCYYQIKTNGIFNPLSIPNGYNPMKGRME